MSDYLATHINPDQIPDNLVIGLHRQAEKIPNQPAFIHLQDGQSNQTVLTYAQLEQRARAIAAHLQNMGLAGKRVLLVYPHGLDFITAFFGCLYANCVAVPTYPPHRQRMLNRFQAIAADAEACIAMSTSFAAAQFQSLIESKSGQAATIIPNTLACYRRNSRCLGRADGTNLPSHLRRLPCFSTHQARPASQKGS